MIDPYRRSNEDGLPASKLRAIVVCGGSILVVVLLYELTARRAPPSRLPRPSTAANGHVEQLRNVVERNPVVEFAASKIQIDAERPEEEAAVADEMRPAAAEVEPPPPPQPLPPPPDPAPAAVSNTRPFADFVRSLTLPDPADTEPVALGPARLQARHLCSLYLLGGETAARSGDALVCERAERGTAERDWEIIARVPGTPTGGTKLARLSIHDDSLWFQWQAEAASHAAAPYLGNCAFRISTAVATHTVALRQVTRASPLPVRYERRTENWALTETPLPEHVQLEFEIAASQALPARFFGNAIIPAAGGETWIDVGPTNDVFARIQVQTALGSKQLSVMVTPWFQVTGQPRPMVATPANLKRLNGMLAQAMGPLQNQLQSLPKGVVKKNKGKGRKPKTVPNPARAAVERQLAPLRQADGELKRLAALQDDFLQQFRLHVRAYHPANETIVDLLVTK